MQFPHIMLKESNTCIWSQVRYYTEACPVYLCTTTTRVILCRCCKVLLQALGLWGSFSLDSIHQHCPRTEYLWSFSVVVCLLFSSFCTLEDACSSDDSHFHQWTTGTKQKSTIHFYKLVMIEFWNIYCYSAKAKKTAWLSMQLNHCSGTG